MVKRYAVTLEKQPDVQAVMEFGPIRAYLTMTERVDCGCIADGLHGWRGRIISFSSEDPLIYTGPFAAKKMLGNNPDSLKGQVINFELTEGSKDKRREKLSPVGPITDIEEIV